MLKWWREKDLIGYIPENILNEKLNEDEIINYIYEKYAEECKYL